MQCKAKQYCGTSKTTTDRCGRLVFHHAKKSNRERIVWEGYYEFDVNQWGVGHGGFHSQSIFFQEQVRNPTAAIGNGSWVRVIYDFGSGSKNHPRAALSDALNRMLNGVDKKSTIDLLVISHFDQDHVNGLNVLSAELEKKKINVARVWAPALTKIEALFAITTSDLTDGPEQESYATFLDDPNERFRELFGRDVEVTPITPDNEPIPLSPGGAGNADAGGGGQIILTAAPGARGLVARPGPAPTSEALWEFQPYVVESTLVGAGAVSAAVGKIIGKPVEKCSLADLIRLAKDKVFLKAFHAAVKQHLGSLKRGTRTSSSRTIPNLSTLCVYSGPISPYDWCRFRGGWSPVDATGRAIPIAPAWFGTGDAGLERLQHVDAMRIALTQSRLDRVGITSAPHHGSHRDSGSPLWDALPNVRWVTIEADNLTGGTRHHHPHTQVLANLATRNLNVHICAASRDFSWSEKGIR